jgi:hypothetical protein
MKVTLPDGAMKAAPAVLVTTTLSSVVSSAVKAVGVAVSVLVVVVVEVLLRPLMLLPQLVRKQKVGRQSVTAVNRVNRGKMGRW